MTGSTYLLHASDIAHTLIVRVTASNGHGPSGPADSGHSAPVSASSSVNAPTASTGGTTGITASGATSRRNRESARPRHDLQLRLRHRTPALRPLLARSTRGGRQHRCRCRGSARQPAASDDRSLPPVVAHNPSGTTTGTDQQFTTTASTGGGGTAPKAVTGAANATTETTVTLGATVNPGGTETSYYFEYGADQSYGQSSQLYSAGSGTTSHAVSGELADLQPDTTYHFRVVAHNDAATARGSDATFTTSPIPAPTNTDPPQISGTPQVGQTLTALHGTWTPTPTSYAYQWRTCDGAGDNCQDIGQATASHFQVTSNLVGKTIRVRVVATGAGGPSHTPADSDASSAVLAGGGGGGGGNPSVTVHLALAPTNDPGRFDLKVGETTVKSAAANGDSGTTNVFTSTDHGLRSRQHRDARRLHRQQHCAPRTGSPTLPSSGPSVDVAAAGTDQIDCTFHNSLQSPGNLTPPSVPGTPVVGTPITADHGSWSRHPDSYHYAWQRCDAAGTSCADIPGAADDPHYTPVAADVADGDHKLRVKVTAHNVAGDSAQAVSDPSTVITAPPLLLSPPSVPPTRPREFV